MAPPPKINAAAVAATQPIAAFFTPAAKPHFRGAPKGSGKKQRRNRNRKRKEPQADVAPPPDAQTMVPAPVGKPTAHATAPLSVAKPKQQSQPVKPSRTKAKLPRINWSLPANAPIMEQAVHDWTHKCGTFEEGMNMAEFCATVPGLTKGTFSQFVTSNPQKRQKVGNGPGRPRLLSEEDEQIAVDLVRRADRGHKGKTVDKIIDAVTELRPDLTRKQAANSFNRTIHPDRKAELSGKVHAQSTTTKRSAITVEQQHRWHTFKESMWKKLIEINSGPDGIDRDSFLTVIEWFIWFWDETCTQARDGALRIIGDAEIKKHERNLDDSRDSMTTLRTGCTKGNGPSAFLCKGERVHTGFTEDFFARQGLVRGTFIEMTPSAFMTIESWRVCVRKLTKAIREMEPVCKFPHFWLLHWLDGVKQHVVDYDATQEFIESKSLVGKEEGDSSHVNQVYDKFVARLDKYNTRELLPYLRSCTSVSRGVVDQWGLVHIMVRAIAECTEEVWADSADACNMNIKAAVSFPQWLERIQAHLQAGATFKCEAPIDKFWLLPGIWHQMTPDKRRGIIATIDRHNGVYTVDCVRELKQCKVAPSDMQKLRICYDLSKKSPDTVDITLKERQLTVAQQQAIKDSDATAKARVSKGLVTFQRIPDHLKGPGKGEALLKWQLSFMKRTTEPTCDCTCHAFLPSAYLDVAISDVQKKLFNPSLRDQTIRELMKDAGGLGAEMKLAKRKLDSFGFVQSECYEVTDPKRMKAQRQAMQLAASLAEVSNAAAAESKAKQAAEDDQLIPLAPAALAKLHKHNMNWGSLTVKEMKSIGIKYFSLRPPGPKKNDVVDQLVSAYDNAQPNARKQFDDDYLPSNPIN